MLDFMSSTLVCPACKKEFYAHSSIVKKMLCGIQQIPANKKVAKILNCKITYFCSDECSKEYEAYHQDNQPNISRWRALLERIKNTSIKCGFAGARIHEINMH